MNEDRPRPRSIDDRFITIASSMLYPWYDITATTKFWPAGRSLNDRNFIDSVWTIGFCGQCRRWLRVSGRGRELLAARPRDCFATPAPIVTRGDELCSGYGTRPEATPRITRGSTSQCVCSFVTEDFTVNVFPHFLHRRSTTSVVAPGFIHSASFRLIGSLHSLHRGGTSDPKST